MTDRLREALAVTEAGRANMLAIIRGQMSNHSHDYARGWLARDELQREAAAQAEARVRDDLVEPPDPRIWQDLPPTRRGRWFDLDSAEAVEVCHELHARLFGGVDPRGHNRNPDGSGFGDCYKCDRTLEALRAALTPPATEADDTHKENTMEKRYNTTDPSSLTKAQASDVIRKIQGRLWLDMDEDGKEFWNPDKEWDVEAIEDVARVLIDAGLAPHKE